MSAASSDIHPSDDETSSSESNTSSVHGNPKRPRRGHGALPLADNLIVDLTAASTDRFIIADDTFSQISVMDPVSLVARKSLHSKDPSQSDFLKLGNSENDTQTDGLSLYLTDDVIFKILNFLSPYDLVHRLGMVNRHYLALSKDNAAGWSSYYSNLMNTKLHVVVADPLSNLRMACRQAINDSRRPFITTRELCYDIVTQQGTIWSFRFKESAGADWTSVDPWYIGQPCRKMVFLSNGTMLNVVPPSSPGSQAPLYESIKLAEPPLRMTWRFLTRPMDLPTRPMGSYIRIQVGGRDVPTYSVFRSPTGNWGFVLESCWGVYASFELPKRIGSPHELNLENDDDTAAIRTVSLPPRSMDPSDMQDETMALTNEIQWREAFLYNVGARVLPEGDEATDEFDRFWRDVRGNNNLPE